MGYVAVQGGIEAIENAEQLSQYVRLKGKSVPLQIRQIQDQMRLLVDRVMGEGGLYSPFHAALAIKQAGGDPIEASFLIRAFRSTLRRLTNTEILNMEEMRVIRRISAAFKNIPGGQILGSTYDYRQRLLDFSLVEEDERTANQLAAYYKQASLTNEELKKTTERWPKVVDILRQQGYVKVPEQQEDNPVIDLTQESITFPAHRSARLQAMARGETGGLLGYWVNEIRERYKFAWPTLQDRIEQLVK